MICKAFVVRGNKHLLIYGEKQFAGNLLGKLTIEVDRANVAEQLFAIDVVGHTWAKAWVSVAELAVHAVQSMGHGIHRVHHKLNFPFLLVTGITANFL